MPNYCSNLLIVDGIDLNKFCEDVKTNDSELSFEKLIPTPNLDNISKEEFAKYFTDDEKQYPFYEHYANSRRDWYAYHIIKWGTKWDAMDIITNHSDDELSYDFTTAWSPPEYWLKNICKKYNCNFTLTSYETGCDFWCQITIENGKIIKEENLTMLEKVAEDLQQQSIYKSIKEQFIETICKMPYIDDNLEDMNEFAFIGENLEHEFGEHYIYKYFDEIKEQIEYLRSAIQSRKQKIKFAQFTNFANKQNLFNELIQFHTCPPLNNHKLLKNGGALYQEAEINFYRNIN